MVKIAICDNDVASTSLIENLLYEAARGINIPIEVDIFFDGLTLKAGMDQGNNYDLIYLDIEMEKLNGIKTAQYIREKKHTVLIIYISSYEKYLKELFEVESFRFIAKPINHTVFFKYFYSAYERIESGQEQFEIKFKNEIEHIPVKEIVYFESEKRYVHVVTENGKYTFYGKLKEVEKQVSSGKYLFIRIHQSYLVNYKYIKKITFLAVELYNGIKLPISEERLKEVRKRFCEIAKGSFADV